MYDNSYIITIVCQGFYFCAEILEFFKFSKVSH